MSSPNLVYYPIQLHMANQHPIFPIGHLDNAEVVLGGVKTTTDFEVIKIMGKTDPYPTFLKIEWDYENYDIIDVKIEQ